MTVSSSAINIKEECMNLFSSKIMFNNCSIEFIKKYKKFYTNKNILTILNDVELVNTAKGFLENNLNITIASKQGYMHRNTLIYRIEKIKKTIGLDIRIFSEAVVFENLLMFYDIVKAANLQ